MMDARCALLSRDEMLCIRDVGRPILIADKTNSILTKKIKIYLYIHENTTNDSRTMLSLVRVSQNYEIGRERISHSADRESITEVDDTKRPDVDVCPKARTNILKCIAKRLARQRPQTLSLSLLVHTAATATAAVAYVYCTLLRRIHDRARRQRWRWPDRRSRTPRYVTIIYYHFFFYRYHLLCTVYIW